MAPDYIYPTIAAVLGAGVSILNNQKVREVHVLVNSNLEAQKALNALLTAQLFAAKTEIGELKAQVAKLIKP